MFCETVPNGWEFWEVKIFFKNYTSQAFRRGSVCQNWFPFDESINFPKFMSVCWKFLRSCVLCHVVLVLGAGVGALRARVSCLWAGRQMWHARGLCCVPGCLVRLFCVRVLCACCGAVGVSIFGEVLIFFR